MRENTDQKISEYELFSRNDNHKAFLLLWNTDNIYTKANVQLTNLIKEIVAGRKSGRIYKSQSFQREFERFNYRNN